MRLNARTFFLLATLLMAVVFIGPELNFQDLLSQGDHGRDLYAFDAVTHGKLPYKDFWWVYGPLMPYYYGLFFKIFGVHITSVLWARALLAVLCSVFFYLSAVCLMSPSLAFLAAAWFTASRQEFFFTYNHIGGIATALIISWCLLSYIFSARRGYLWIALIASFILGLIKINFGLAAFFSILLSVALINTFKKYSFSPETQQRYLALCALVPTGLGLIYGWLLHTLPFYALRQCMPYFGDDQPYHASPLSVIVYYFSQHGISLIHSPIGMLMGICLHGCTAVAIIVLVQKKIDAAHRQNILLALAVIGLFFLAFFHEFLVSGVWYRTYWSLPFLDLFHFVMIATAFTLLPKALRVFVWAVIGGIVAVSIIAHTGSIESQKKPYRYLSMDRGHIYVGNEPEWTATVNQVTFFLNTTLKKEDLFLALPYDCLYYYLTGKESPTRQLIFFDHIKIPPRQEIAVIQELLATNTVYVLMSSRIISNQIGLGVFGKTYCPLLSAYIHNHFKPLVREGGDWTKPPGWADNHGVIILKAI